MRKKNYSRFKDKARSFSSYMKKKVSFRKKNKMPKRSKKSLFGHAHGGVRKILPFALLVVAGIAIFEFVTKKK